MQPPERRERQRLLNLKKLETFGNFSHIISNTASYRDVHWLNWILDWVASVVFICGKFLTPTLISYLHNSHIFAHTSHTSHTWPQSHYSWWQGHLKFLTLLQERQCTAWQGLHSEGTAFLTNNNYTNISMHHFMCTRMKIKWIKRELYSKIHLT